jgi:hypothetical protein
LRVGKHALHAACPSVVEEGTPLAQQCRIVATQLRDAGVELVDMSSRSRDIDLSKLDVGYVQLPVA